MHIAKHGHQFIALLGGAIACFVSVTLARHLIRIGYVTSSPASLGILPTDGRTAVDIHKYLVSSHRPASSSQSCILHTAHLTVAARPGARRRCQVSLYISFPFIFWLIQRKDLSRPDGQPTTVLSFYHSTGENRR